LYYVHVDGAYTINADGEVWTILFTPAGADEVPVFTCNSDSQMPITEGGAVKVSPLSGSGPIPYATIIPFTTYTAQRPHLDAGDGTLSADPDELSEYDGVYKVRPSGALSVRAMYTHTAKPGVHLRSHNGVWGIYASASAKAALYLSHETQYPYGPYPEGVNWVKAVEASSGGGAPEPEPEAEATGLLAWASAKFSKGLTAGGKILGLTVAGAKLESMEFKKVRDYAGNLVLHATSVDTQADSAAAANSEFRYYDQELGIPRYYAGPGNNEFEWTGFSLSYNGGKWLIQALHTNPKKHVTLWHVESEAVYPLDIEQEWTATSSDKKADAQIMTVESYAAAQVGTDLDNRLQNASAAHNTTVILAQMRHCCRLLRRLHHCRLHRRLHHRRLKCRPRLKKLKPRLKKIKSRR
jgi:hypothetical protein